jgi:hypothetical protein
MAAEPVRERLTLKPSLYHRLSELARLRDCSTAHLRDEIARGNLRAERGVGDVWQVRHLEALRYLGEDASAGHEALSSGPDNRDALREVRRLLAEAGERQAMAMRLLSELDE